MPSRHRPSSQGTSLFARFRGAPRPKRGRPAARRLHVQSLEHRWPFAVGDMDTTFSGDGKFTVGFSTTGSQVDAVHDVAQQLDGKLVLVGEVQKLNGTEGAIVRLNADGSLDTSFSSDGKTRSSGFTNVNIIYYAVGIQNDGKLVVAGRYQTYGVDGDFLVVRVNANGTLDTSFNAPYGYSVIPFDGGGNKDDRAFDLLIQPDGKIVLAGWARTNTIDYDMAVARVNANGTLDTSFSGDGKARVTFDQGNVGGEVASAVARQADGKLVLAGIFSSAPGTSAMAVARLNENGSLDATFAGNGRHSVSFDGVRASAADVAIASDGKIVLSGYTENSAGNSDIAVARLLTDGSLDPSFSGDGGTTIAFDLGGSLEDGATAVKLISGDRIVVAGKAQRSSAGDYDIAVARLRTDGQLDTSFSSDGKQAIAFNAGGDKADSADAIWIQSDGKIVVAGLARIGNNGDGFQSNADFAVARLLGNAAPIATKDRYVLGSPSGANNATASVFTNDSDGDGNLLALSRTALPTKGTLTLRSNGTFSYTPGSNFHGYDTFKYRISDAYSTGNEVTVELFSHTGALVAKAYQTVLGRPFDLPGLEYWVQQIEAPGGSLSDFATGVFESRERLEPIIKNWYRQYLGRAQDPSQAEVNFYYNRWRNEGGPQHMLPDVFASQEFYQNSGNTNRGWILELYRLIVQRTTPPSESEIAFYEGRLNDGASRQAVVRGFLFSPEKLGLIVNDLYQRILGRAPTSTEKQTEVTALGQGKTEKDLQLQLLDSAEYRSVPSKPNTGNAVRY